MRPPARLLAHVALLSALVVGTLTSAAAMASAPTSAPPAGVAGQREVTEYVALGDSYTSGPFVPKTNAAFGCFRSTRNYPSLLAGALRVERFTDASCAGATTRHLRRHQPTGLFPAPPQLAALTADTDLVTLGIGGNDFGVFAGLVSVCPRLRAENPDGHPCRDHFQAGGGGLLADVARVRARVERGLGDIRRRAPEARVLVVGYPRVAPRTGTCPAVVPLAEGDYRYADRVQRRLNAALRQAAQARGADFVDTYAASRGHDACAGDAAWVNGGTTDTRRAQSYHPFASYMRAVTDLSLARLSGR